MNKNGQNTSLESNDSISGKYQNNIWGKVLPLAGSIRKKISKLNLSLNYDWQYKKDEAWLSMETEIVPPRRKKKEIKKFRDTQNQELLLEEVTSRIISDPILSQSSGNPSWYPPVPRYTIPLGRKYAQNEIRTIQKARKKADVPNFVRDNVHITRAPLTVKEFEKRYDSLIQVNSGILRSTIIHEKDIDMITGHINTPNCSYPEIKAQVGYLVSTLINPDKSVELAGIYVYQNSIILKALLEFLANLDVCNPDDLMEAKIILNELYWSITPKL